jgi:hypothetical protein
MNIEIIILWIACGCINILCVFLTEVTWKRPDYADEYVFLSWRTFAVFIVGPIITSGIWFGPFLAKWDLDMYNRK